MKLNRKGYMTIEIILAAVITFFIAFFLIDITMDLSGTTDDAYTDTVLVTDKALITKNIKENLESDIRDSGCIKNVDCRNNNCYIDMEHSRKVLSIYDNKIVYRGNNSYFKDLDERLSNVKLTSTNSDNYYNFKISGTNIFVDDNYDMNIIVYNECK